MRRAVNEPAQAAALLFGEPSDVFVYPHAGCHHQKRRYEKEHEGIRRAQIFEERAQDGQRQSVEQRQKTQHGVEHTDAGEVGRRTEVAHALLSGRIIDVDGNGDETDPVPGGEDEQLEFSLVARGEQREPAELPDGIEAEARLRVGQGMQSLHRKPEIGKPVGKQTASRGVDAREIATAHDEGSGVFDVGLHEPGDFFGVMLPVGVERDGVGKAHLQRFGKTAFQRIAFASVAGIIHEGDAGHRSEDVARSVSRTVVHYNDVVALLQCGLNHSSDGAAVVVGRNHDADAAFAHGLLQVVHRVHTAV